MEEKKMRAHRRRSSSIQLSQKARAAGVMVTAGLHLHAAACTQTRPGCVAAAAVAATRAWRLALLPRPMGERARPHACPARVNAVSGALDRRNRLPNVALLHRRG